MFNACEGSCGCCIICTSGILENSFLISMFIKVQLDYYLKIFFINKYSNSLINIFSSRFIFGCLGVKCFTNMSLVF